MSDARREIFVRIRAALADVPPDEPPAWTGPNAYITESPLSHAERLERFAARVAEYRAQVVRVADQTTEIAGAIGQACATHTARRLVVPSGLPNEWLPPGAQLLHDRPAAPLDLATLATAEGVVTTCALAIADTGTIVLDAGTGQGRRTLTLLPDLHVCVVRADRVVGGVPEAIALLYAGTRSASRPLTFISGPSATSDIELERVEGVHGPRRLHVIIAG